MAKAFLGIFKRLLVEWEFSAPSVSYDLERQSMAVAGQEVLRVMVDGFAFKLEWADAKWAQWAELLEDEAFKGLVKTAEDKLEMFRGRMDKGKGRGVAA